MTDPHGFERPSFDGIANFRDFGGVATRSGAQVARGRLYRAAHLAEASDADLARFADLGIALIVDLRRPRERRAQPNRILAGATVLSSDLGEDIEAPHIEFLRQGDTSDAAVERYLLGYYAHAADEPRHRALFADTFQALRSLDGAVLVHCAAGKDRTGLLVALIQSVLGVPAPAIMAEYERTNAAMLIPQRIAAASVHLQTLTGQAPSDAVVRALLGVSVHHLRHALAAIAARHGSLDAYLDGLGIDRAGRAGVRARLTIAA